MDAGRRMRQASPCTLIFWIKQIEEMMTYIKYQNYF
jgi:hypothetical protein